MSDSEVDDNRLPVTSSNNSGPGESTSGQQGADVSCGHATLLSPSIVVLGPHGTAALCTPSPPPPPPPPPPPAPPLTCPPSPSSGLVESSCRRGSQTRRLQWSKIPASRLTAAAPDNIWATIRKTIESETETEAEMKPDLTRLEQLFSTENVTSFAGEQLNSDFAQTTLSRRTDEIQLIDSKRSMNVSIFLRQFGSTHSSTIVEWLRDGDSALLGPDRLRALLRIVPEPHEVDLLTPYIDRDTTRPRLAAAERFYLQLIALPNYKQHIEALIIKEDFQTTIDALKPAVDAAILTARDIRSSKALREILYVVLVAGNFLNAGGHGGEAAGFRLSSLLKLRDIRANKPPINLMHYVAMEAQKRDSRIVDHLRQLKYLSEASQYTVQSLTSDIKSLKDNVKFVSDQLSVTHESFRHKLTSFVKSAESELKQLELDQIELEELRQQLASYFCEDVVTFRLDDCISTINTFTQQFIRAVDENEKRHEMDQQVERRRRQREQQATRRARSAQRGLSSDGRPQFMSCDDISQSSATHQLQLPSSSSGRRLSAPERQTSTPVSPRSPVDAAPQRAFHAAASMSVDVLSSQLPVADDLVQFLINSEDSRPLSCTPPRHRRRPSKTNLVVDAQLTQRERTPSPCLSMAGSSPSLSVVGSDSPGVSPVDINRPVRTRRSPTSRQRSDFSLRGSSSGQLLLSVRRRDDEDAVEHSPYHQAAAGRHKSGSVGDLLDDVATTPRSSTHADSHQPATCAAAAAASFDQVQLDCVVNQADANQNSQTTDETQNRRTQSTDRELTVKPRLRQLSDRCVNYDHSSSSSSVNRSNSSSPSSSSSSSSSARAQSGKTSVDRRRAPHGHSSSRHVPPQRAVTAGPSRTVTQDVQRSTTSVHNTSRTSFRNSLTSISTDSEKLLKEFEAIKKLKLFAGLGRHSRKSTGTGRGGGRVEDDVDTKQSKPKCKTASAVTHSQTTSSTVATSAPSKPSTTKNSAARRSSAQQVPVLSPRPGNGSALTVVGLKKKTAVTLGVSKTRKPGQKSALKPLT